jgi:hypothetical protein
MLLTLVSVAFCVPPIYIIKPFDLVLKADYDNVGEIISTAQSATDGSRGNQWTHVGVIVDSSVLPLKELKPGKLYVYHSTNGDTNPVDKRFKKRPKDGEYTGPSIHELDRYFSNFYKNSVIAIAPLVKPLRKEINNKQKDIQEIMQTFHKRMAPYVFTPEGTFTQMLGSLDSASYNERNENNGKVFCSQFVAKLYKAVGFNLQAGQSDIRKELKSGQFTPKMISVSRIFEESKFTFRDHRIVYADRFDSSRILRQPPKKRYEQINS